MTDHEQHEHRLVMVDGREALAYLLIKPNPNGTGVIIDAGANGISKSEAAVILRHVARQWDGK